MKNKHQGNEDGVNKRVRTEGEFDDLTYSPEAQPSEETGLTPFLGLVNIQAAVDATPLLGLANIQQPAVAYMFPNMSELPANNHLEFNHNDLFDYVPGNLNPEFMGEMVASKAI